ncbi:ZINC FINGER PROTEIN CONSTANS-LIKE 10 [Salix purpurea]|uniref:ZINC FINGER PROTEIN CONSTANS-LIKE 10 n=1 Tax=Salix purpurea TaxID=77065 RepID=A0A9Q1A0H0_SALPP|nr:ZINC FINGER PROTEIN CONSTANS-LIKE 10 [Salix purpurea]
MEGCELCGSSARMFCESDQASLCWDCDEKVHSANFLVAKHCRTLLCQVCRSPTPWKSSGSKLCPTVSVCESCFTIHNNKNNHLQAQNAMASDQESREAGNDLEESENDQESDDDDDDADDDSDEYDEEEDEEEDGDNQVVPWSGPTASSSSSLAPPVSSSSSSDEEISCAGRNGFLKRMRHSNVDLDSDDEIGCSSPHNLRGGIMSNEEGNSSSSSRPWKQARTSVNVEEDGQAMSRSTAIIDSLKRLQEDLVTNGENASAAILGICKLSRDQSL